MRSLTPQLCSGVESRISRDAGGSGPAYRRQVPNAILWLRRDLRLRDNPALRAALAAGETVPLFVLDPALWGPAGAPRRAWLVRSLRALDESLDGHLVVRHGHPETVVPALAREVE